MNHIALQLAISNPNQEVLVSLAKAGVVELIGKEWYFVRVHDAVQICLRHVQSLNEFPNTQEVSSDNSPNAILFERLLKQRKDEFSTAEVESGNGRFLQSKDADPQLEPLLSKK